MDRSGDQTRCGVADALHQDVGFVGTASGIVLKIWWALSHNHRRSFNPRSIYTKCDTELLWYCRQGPSMCS